MQLPSKTSLSTSAHSHLPHPPDSFHSATHLHTCNSLHVVILHCPATMKLADGSIVHKIMLKLSLDDESGKRKALKLAAGVQGVDSVAVDMKEKKMTVIGDVDPVYLTPKLRKFGFSELLSLGPVKEEKKEGEKKEEKKPQEGAKKENKAEAPKYKIVHVPPIYDSRAYEYTAVSEENPNACVIY